MRSALTYRQVRSLAMLPGALPSTPIRDERTFNHAANGQVPVSSSWMSRCRRPATTAPANLFHRVTAPSSMANWLSRL